MIISSLTLAPLDYTTTSQTISFTSGQGVGSTVDITIPLIDDNITEAVEYFFGSLTLIPTNLDVSVTPNQTKIFITDNNSKIYVVGWKSFAYFLISLKINKYYIKLFSFAFSFRIDCWICRYSIFCDRVCW